MSYVFMPIEVVEEIQDVLDRLNAGEEVSDDELTSFLSHADAMADHIMYLQSVIMTLTEAGYKERSLQ
jgi:hypothetical protein